MLGGSSAGGSGSGKATDAVCCCFGGCYGSVLSGVCDDDEGGECRGRQDPGVAGIVGHRINYGEGA